MTGDSPFDSLFALESGPDPQATAKSPVALDGLVWKVLLVDDEADMHAVLRLALQGMVVEGRPLQLLDARSAAEARICLQVHPDVALILLDVVMESEQAGLDLVHHIRRELGNPRVQILICTGQPGYAPQRQVIVDYEIDGYRLKSELSADKIFVSVHAALRAYRAQLQLLSQQRELEGLLAALSERKARLQATIESSPDAIVLTDHRGLITGWNPSTERMFGYSADELLGRSLTQRSGDAGADVPRHGLTLLEAGELPQRLGGSHEIEARRRDGQRFPAEIALGSWMSHDGRRYSANLRDISERKRMEEQIRQLAFYDPLTRLPNRRLLQERLAHAVAVCRRTDCHGALMMLDLDNFKPLNDTHGHDVGDLLLIEVARRVRHALRSVDTVGRLGGDEFLIVLGELPAARSLAAQLAARVAEKIRAAVAETYWLQSEPGQAPIEHHCSATIGVTLFDGGSEWAGLCVRADAAMYAAKQAGRNGVRLAEAD